MLACKHGFNGVLPVNQVSLVISFVLFNCASWQDKLFIFS